MAALLTHLSVMQHPTKVPSATADGVSPAVELLAALLLHYSPSVRRSATAATVACCKKSASLGTGIAAGLQHWLRVGAPIPILQDFAADDPALSPIAIGHRCHRAAASIARATADSKSVPDAELFARLLQIGTHPHVAVGRSSFRATWSSIRRCSSLQC